MEKHQKKIVKGSLCFTTKPITPLRSETLPENTLCVVTNVFEDGKSFTINVKGTNRHIVGVEADELIVADEADVENAYTFKIAFIRKDGTVCEIFRNTTVKEVQEYAQKVMRDNPGKYWDYEIGNYTNRKAG